MAPSLTLKKQHDFIVAVDKVNISSEARDLLWHYMAHPSEHYTHHESYITSLRGWSHPLFCRVKKELVTEGIIFSEYVYENGKRKGTRVVVNYDYPKVKNPNVSKPNVSCPNVSSPNVSKPNVRDFDALERNKINRKREDPKEGIDTHICSSVASAPAGAAASVCVSPSPSPESPSQEGKTKASKAAKAPAVPVSENPPLQEDIAAFIRKTVSGRPEASAWNDQNISGTAFDIWNHYTNTGWKTAACCPMYIWQNAVIGWLRRNSWLPEQSQPHPSPVPAASPAPASQELSGLLPGQWAGAPVNQKPQQKSFKQQEWDWIQRPLTDPDAFTVESAAHCIFNATCEDEVQGTLNSIPAHLHERALALAEQMRKEQGDRPRIIRPSTFTHENEDETS